MFEFLSVILIFAGLSLLVVIHELGHFLVAKSFGLLVEEFGFGLPPKIWGKKIGETLYSINWLPFGGFVRIYGERPSAGGEEEKSGVNIERSFGHQKIWKRALVTVAGVLMNFLLGWFLISLVFAIGIPQTVLVADVQAGGIADLAGIQKGDQFYEFKTSKEFVEFIDINKGFPMTIKIKRGEEYLDMQVTPRILVPEGEGNLGIYLVETGLLKTGLFESFTQGFSSALKMVGGIFLGLVDLVLGIFTDLSILNHFVGPVGIVNIAIQTTRLGLANFIQFLALISLNLAVFNVFPIPALDGGRLLFLALEKLKGGPLNQKLEMAFNAIGFAVLLCLIIFITFKDILTLL